MEKHGSRQGRFYFSNVGTKNAEREGTTSIVRRYGQLEQLSRHGILPVMGSKDQGYRNCRRMAIKTLDQQLCNSKSAKV